MQVLGEMINHHWSHHFGLLLEVKPFSKCDKISSPVQCESFHDEFRVKHFSPFISLTLTLICFLKEKE